MITERQNTLPRKKRAKKEKVHRIKNIQVNKTEQLENNATEEEYDDDEDEEEDEIDEEENERDSNILEQADVETKAALLVILIYLFIVTQKYYFISHTHCSLILFFFCQREKEISTQLSNKLKELESQVVRGGRNILDTYSERQAELEKRLNDIAERKKREIEMQQQLELQEETTIEIRETLTTAQQEVELKTKKLKKCYAKYMVSYTLLIIISYSYYHYDQFFFLFSTFLF